MDKIHLFNDVFAFRHNGNRVERFAIANHNPRLFFHLMMRIQLLLINNMNLMLRGKHRFFHIKEQPSPEIDKDKDVQPETPKAKIDDKAAPFISTVKKITNVIENRPPEQWKIFPGKNVKADFNFVAPKVDFKGMVLSEDEKKIVEEKALGQFKAAMKVMDNSIADASLEMVGEKKEHPELLETLNKFSGRYLDVYKAYIEVLQEEKELFFPPEIAIAKSYGYTHAQIKDLMAPSQWYQRECSLLKEKIKNLSPSTALGDGFIYHLALNDFNPEALKNLKGDGMVEGTECSQLDLTEALKDPKIAAAVEGFCSRINGNPKEGKAIKDLGKKMLGFRSSIATIEQFKEKLASFDITQTIDLQDPAVALQEELKGRIGDGRKEPGYIADPQSLIDIVAGKREDMDASAQLRHKLYFIYKSKGIANEIAASPEMVAKVNAKLAKNGWQLENGVCDFLRAKSPGSPVFKLGNYAAENHKGIRTPVTPEEVQARFEADQAFTFEDGERIAAGRHRNVDELNRPFRFKMSREEELTYLKLIENTRDREFVSKLGSFAKNNPSKFLGKPDAGSFEHSVEALKKSMEQPWIPGKDFWNVATSSTCDSPYLKAVEALGLPQQAGISGSTDQTLTMAGIVGITSVEEINRLRLMYLGWMTSCDDHSVDEILTSAKAFGVPYTPAPDYYKQIYPQDPRFVDKVAAGQKKRGYELPDYYLSSEFAAKTLASLRSEKEAVQAKAVADKLASNSLFLKAFVSPPKTETEDLFHKDAWVPFMRKLNTPKKHAPDNGKIKFTYNPVTKTMEPHERAAEPFYTGTKKTSVSLLPTHGKILPYGWEEDESVGLLFDREGSPFKENYIFKEDALTDNKWWRRFYTKSEIEQPDFLEKLARDVEQIQSGNGTGKKQSFDHLRMNSLDELIAKIEKVSKFRKHNEILASLKKDKIEGVFTLNKKVDQNAEGSELYARLKGIISKISMKNDEGVDVPLFIIDQARDKGLHLYSSEEQLKDLQKLKENNGGEFDAVVEYLAVKTKLDQQSIALSLKNELADLEKQFELVA